MLPIRPNLSKNHQVSSALLKRAVTEVVNEQPKKEQVSRTVFFIVAENLFLGETITIQNFELFAEKSIVIPRLSVKKWKAFNCLF